MKIKSRTCLICDCEGTMPLDGKALGKGLGATEAPAIHTHLCRAGVAAYTTALGEKAPLMVACTQEAPLFRELADEAGISADLSFVNIRERAGWNEAGSKKALPKIAALLADAAFESEPAGAMTLKSDGLCLVYGSGQVALDAARKLAGRLNVTLLLKQAGDAMPANVADVAILTGEISKASGHFGAFEIIVDKYAPVIPSSRQSFDFAMARDGAVSSCALILDLSGGTPLFAGHDRRDGYFHVDPGHPAAIAEALFEISDLVGEFEKPLYVGYERSICAHSRNGVSGCTRCLDVCPASAITPDEDGVLIDPAICGGCGSCHATCPSGAVSYAYPGREDLITRVQKLAENYLAAGGKRPVLLLHNNSHGAELIAASARFGRGLPINVIPLSVHEVTLAGHDLFASALGAGFEQIVVLASARQRDELAGLESQVELIETITGGLGFKGARVHLEVADDPDGLEDTLYGLAKIKALKPDVFSATGDKRTIARSALTKLHDQAPDAQDTLALPEGAPYGRIHIDTQGCTLCLACVGSCPANALLDNPDLPQVRFVEHACLQCGICRVACPENVITLEARFDFTPAALSPQTLNEEEPAECIRCGQPFGTKSTIARITEKLAGKHAMFADEDSAKLIQMCDDCRILTHAEADNNPFSAGERPRLLTTEDYLAAEEKVAQSGGKLSLEDFIKDDE